MSFSQNVHTIAIKLNPTQGGCHPKFSHVKVFFPTVLKVNPDKFVSLDESTHNLVDPTNSDFGFSHCPDQSFKITMFSKHLIKI
jgi:hypothetical protein